MLPLLTRKEAKATGSKRYFTNLPCHRGHISERCTANGQCLDCGRLWGKENPEKQRQACIKWKKNNPLWTKNFWRMNQERLSLKSKEYYACKRDLILAKASEWAKKNPAKARAKLKEWRVKNPTALNDWRNSNIERARSHSNNRRARELNAEGTHSHKDIHSILQSQNSLCFWCSADISTSYTVDHYIPLSRGGSNWPENLVMACRSCNSSKNAKLPDEFRASLDLRDH